LQLRNAASRGQGVLFSSHVLTEVEQVCDRVAILQLGRLVHWQNMRVLRTVRSVRARLNHPMPVIIPPLSISALHSDGLVLQFQHEGPLPELLRWLSELPIADLRIEPVGLADIYQRYHQSRE
jgi:ABC-2 type transport system ATP-binding protein